MSGDFNVVTGTVRDSFKRIMGPFGSGTPNDNSTRLLDFCLGADLRVVGSWLERCDMYTDFPGIPVTVTQPKR